jgi:exodeoxyribonuclease-3
MKVLSWNIQQGGGSRLPRIIDAIIAQDPDVILLTEFHARPGDMLCAKLKAAGWPYAESTNPDGSDNGICAISRTAMVRKSRCPLSADLTDVNR